MATGTFRRARRLIGSAAPALALIGLAGCGSSHPGAFAWFHAQPPPSSWRIARVPTGGELAYPPTWRLQPGDAGTATAALIAPGGGYLGYLNLTPRQGPETLSNWPTFRVQHNAADGDRAVTRLAGATGLRFRTGRGSCVKDAYTTVSHARYIEIACLVAGARTESVIVAAAPPARWDREAAVIERAIEGVKA